MKTKVIFIILLIISISFQLFSQNNSWVINVYAGEPTGISVEKEFLKHFSTEIAFGRNELFYNDNISEQYECFNVTQLSEMYSASLITKYKINYKKFGVYAGAEIQIIFFKATINRKIECIPPNTASTPGNNEEEIQKLLGLLPNLGIIYPVYKDKLFIFSEASFYIPGISFRRTNPQFRLGLKYSF